VLAGSRDKRLTHFVHITAVSYPHRKAKAHSPVGISPVRYRRIDEFRVWHNHTDVVVGANDCTAGANLLHLTGDPRYFDAISDRDGSFGQDHQATDEIARDILQTEADPYTDRACKNSQRAEMNAGIFQNNQNANYQHDVADDLGDGVLQRAIKSALGKESVEQESLRPGRQPKHRDQQRDEQENLEETERDAG